jgi:uncharacterized protein YecE (DUF72 family)
MTVAGLYIGTSGWSYPKGQGSWKGHFYPRGNTDELGYYSRFFNSVEINSSFYRPPNPEHVRRWCRKVPDGFLFTAKLWQKFTHPGMFQRATGIEAVISRGDIELFKSGLEPLVQSGKLGALLAQFPPGFTNNSYERQVLKAVINTFAVYRLAIELRHKSWSDDPDTAGLLSEGNATWVQIDEPRFKSSIAGELPLTSDIAYFRFHGRNAADWWSGNNESRYRYFYSPEEIQELAKRVGRAKQKTRLTFAFFNNHWQGYAPRNATSIIQLMELPIGETALPEPGPASLTQPQLNGILPEADQT